MPRNPNLRRPSGPAHQIEYDFGCNPKDSFPGVNYFYPTLPPLTNTQSLQNQRHGSLRQRENFTPCHSSSAVAEVPYSKLFPATLMPLHMARGFFILVIFPPVLKQRTIIWNSIVSGTPFPCLHAFPGTAVGFRTSELATLTRSVRDTQPFALPLM